MRVLLSLSREALVRNFTIGRCATVIAALALVATAARAQSTEAIRKLYPASARCCVLDQANVLSPAERSEIDASLERIKASTHFNIAVVTLPTIGDADVNDVALQIGRDWGVGSAGAPGDEGRARGMVVLVVPKTATARGQVATQVARGAEGSLTDATIGEIRRRALDDFRAARYGAGIEKIIAGVEPRIVAAAPSAALERVAVPLATQPAPVVPQEESPLGVPPELLIIAAFGLWLFVRSRRRLAGSGQSPRRWDSGDSFFPNSSSSGSSSSSDSSSSSSSSSSDSSSSFDGGGDYGGGGGSDSF